MPKTDERVKPRKLKTAEMRAIAEVVSEMSRWRGTQFDAEAVAVQFGRAAMVDPQILKRILDLASRIRARAGQPLDRSLMRPLGPLYRQLERDCAAILKRER